MTVKRVTGGAGIVCAVSVIIGIVLQNGNVRTTEEGLKLIGNSESCRRDPYVCPAGILTDGLGNTHGVKPGTVKNNDQIAKDWEKNILIAENCINTYFRGRDMNDNQFSAMTSAAFNMGCNGIRFYYSKAQGKKVQTSINKWAQSGQWVNMCNHLPDFVNSGGKRLKGLEIRREAERKLCLR